MSFVSIGHINVKYDTAGNSNQDTREPVAAACFQIVRQMRPTPTMRYYYPVMRQLTKLQVLQGKPFPNERRCWHHNIQPRPPLKYNTSYPSWNPDGRYLGLVDNAASMNFDGVNNRSPTFNPVALSIAAKGISKLPSQHETYTFWS